MSDDLEEPGPNAANELRSFIERVERLTAERQTFTDDIKEVYGEAKGRGFDVKQLRKVVAMRKIDAEKRKAEEQVLDTYLLALGMI